MLFYVGVVTILRVIYHLNNIGYSDYERGCLWIWSEAQNLMFFFGFVGPKKADFVPTAVFALRKSIVETIVGGFPGGSIFSATGLFLMIGER